MATGRKKPDNRSMALRLGVVVVAMFGFGYALVPLYNVFCEVTGLNGKTGVLSDAESRNLQVDQNRQVTVEFVAIKNGVIGGWEFRPEVFKMKVEPGRLYTTYYYARNPTERDMETQSVPSVSPAEASLYFSKTECFCFSRQDFQPKEGRKMPLTFVVEKELPEDISTVTLSYTIFEARGKAGG